MLIRGQTLVEILLAIALAALMLPALLTGLVASREGKAQQEQRLFATAWGKEAMEAVRSVREAGWAGVATDGVYHPAIVNGKWIIANGVETVDGYTRSIVVAGVYRDSSGSIVTTGGTLDPSTKKITTTVMWVSPKPSSVSSLTYISRYRDNMAYIETTQADFEAGTRVNTTVTNTSGGEVTLGAGGTGNWCEPSLIITAVDLPKNGVANAVTAIQGRVFAGTGDNASGVSFANVEVSNANPPVGTILGTFDGYKTNGGVFGDSSYAYLATDTNSKEIIILDISHTPYSEVGYFDSPGPADSNAVFVLGNSGYMTVGDKLYNFDLSSKNGPRPMMDPDGLTLAGTGTKVYVVGGYAYVTIAGSTSEMQIVSLANPASLAVVGQVEVDPTNVYSGENGQDVFVNSSGTRAYLIVGQNLPIKEVYIVDVSTKSGDQPIVGSYDTTGMAPRGVTAVTGNKAIVVGSGGEEYQVVDIANESDPVKCGGLNIDSGVNGVASVVETDGDAYSYIITGDASSELKIIAGGPGGQYAAAGTFESKTFDTGYTTVFNRLSATANLPNQTSIRYQVGITDAVTGSCSGAVFDFVGPDGTNSTFFSGVNNPLPFGSSGRCFRYKVFLSTEDVFGSPILEDVTVNYSP